MRRVIINSTPLIALSNIRKLHLLKDIYGEVFIPRAVYNEISAKPESVCKKAVDDSLDFIHVQDIKNQMAKSMYKTQLHDGEVEVMILALETDADLVVIDDANAKKHAKYLELTVTGTLGILIRAKQEGYIKSLKPLLEEMVEKNIYLSKKIIDKCLEIAGDK